MNERRSSEENEYGWLVLLFVGAVLVYGLWGWNYHLWDKLEPVPGRLLRSLVDGGAWLTIEADGVPIPPLYYWMTGALAKGIGSTHAFVLRIPTFLSAAVLVTVTAAVTARCTSREIGLLSGLVTGTAVYFAWQATRLSPVMTGALFIVGSLYVQYELLVEKPSSVFSGAASFLLPGLGVLAVGPVALVPVPVLAVMALVEKEASARGKLARQVGWGLVVLALVLSSWWLPLVVERGWMGLYEIAANPLAGFLPGEEMDVEPVWFYPEKLAVHFLPWTLFLLIALPVVVRVWRDRRIARVSIVFVFVYLIAVGVFPGKNEVVLLPVLPVLSVVMATVIERRFLRSDVTLRPLLVTGGVIGGLMVCGSVFVAVRGADLILKESYLRPLPVHPLVTAYSMAVVLCVSGIAMVVSAWRRAPRLVLGSMAAGIALILLTAKGVLAPNLDARENLRAERPPAKGVQNIFLTWEKQDMVHTMTINYHTPVQSGNERTVVLYDTESRSGRPNGYRFRERAESRTVRRLKRSIHHATLTGLEPDTTYYFIAGSAEMGFSEEQSFRTLPASGELRFVVGGDMGTSDEVRQLHRVAARTDPQFALIGGDIAYADGKWRNTATWHAWYRAWTNAMRRPDGQLIPAILAIGNHERNDRSETQVDGDRFKMAPFYFHYFEQGEQSGYFGKSAGDRLFVLTLDTGYINTVSEQTNWIREELRKKTDSTYQVALYHRAMYPAVKRVKATEKRMRSHWEPLFNRFGVDVGFEHDGHAFKRTYPLRNGERHRAGIPYLGEGAWGIPPNKPDSSRPYLLKAERRRHVWSVRMTRDRMQIRALDTEGNEFDRLTVTPRDGAGTKDGR